MVRLEQNIHGSYLSRKGEPKILRLLHFATHLAFTMIVDGGHLNPKKMDKN